VISVSDCYVVNNDTPTSATYPFILLNKGNLTISGVFVSGISFSGKDHLAVINANGDASMSLLDCSFDNVASGGIIQSLITNIGQVSSKLLVILINNSLIHNIKTTEAINGAAFTFSGGSSSNIIVHNSKFENITGKSESSVGGTMLICIVATIYFFYSNVTLRVDSYVFTSKDSDPEMNNPVVVPNGGYIVVEIKNSKYDFLFKLILVYIFILADVENNNQAQ
jgi:hypothetical protein